MNSEKKIIELCETALTLEADERDAFIESACAGNVEQIAAVQSLLNAVDESADFMKISDGQREYKPNDRIGEYRIVRKLGAGGMGHVYLAERDMAGYAQSVALKILRTHLLSTDMIALFNEERRILARLNHPYIAHLMDGGTTEDGLPYLVMELVQGVPIDTYCDEQRLSIKERLQLLQKVALAIQSAHQNLVVHSDLKPGNILITEDGIPKLLDFGIARLIRRETRTAEVEKSKSETVVLTPDYASPEQISSNTVTTASDIYSLGVLTYELLVGQTPYHVDATSREVIATQVATGSIEPPSTRVRTMTKSQEMSELADRRKTSPPKLARRLAGDLDAVLTKALAKDPTDRYVSASAFADDLMRSSLGLTVAARGDSLSYRAGKFVSRYRISVAAASLALLAVFAGLGVSLWQARIAKLRFDDLYGFTEAMIFDLHDEILEVPGATKARQKLTQESIHYLDRLSKDAAGDKELQLNLSKAYKRLGDVLGNPNEANLGDVAKAIESYQKALAIADQLSRGGNDTYAVVRQKALVHEKLADVLAWQGDMDKAIAHSELSLSVFKSLAIKAPYNDKDVESAAISYIKYGDLLGHPSFSNAGQPIKSLAQYNRALETIRPLAERDAAPANAVRYFALIHERIGTIRSLQREFVLALESFETSKKLREQLAAKNSGNGTARRDVAIAYEKIADVSLASGDAQGSLPHYNKALSIYRELANSDREDTHALRTLAIGLENMAEGLLAAEDRASALTSFDEALMIRRKLALGNPDNVGFANELSALTERISQL